MNGFVYALDADSGKLIWRVQVDEHPQVRLTGSFTLYDGRLYVPTASWEEMSSSDPKYECCTSRGSLSALDAATGKVIWKMYPIADKPVPIAANKFGTKIFGPSGAGIWTTPTLDTKRGLIYVGTGNTFTGEDQPLSDSVLAIEMKTGKVRWSQRGTVGPDVSSGFCRFVDGCKNGPDLDFGATVVLGHLPNGKDFVFAGHKSGVGFGLDPDTGAVLWKYKAGIGGTWGGMEWGTTFDGMFVTTGEILIKSYAVEGTGNQRTIVADLEWTFPLEFVEVTVGDGKKVERHTIRTTDLAPNSSKRFTIPVDATGKSWVRFAAYDSAGNPAFAQPQWFNPANR